MKSNSEFANTQNVYYYKGSKDVDEVVIPDNVTEIGNNAFSGCHLKILQFQMVLLRLVIMLLKNVPHLKILQFQMVLQKLVNVLFLKVHHLQIL